mmetsp:Transcript_7118/g.15364  ORF Transcript_7118/g.15364 Transcript_7118/m.15364 type:complete len:341 (-) Transcript_7118:79-1101(-)|eukprot:CAMPEP_0170603462 /NCGR_PEP_ID=MMETSP0224-20130122/18924_1 /TAXON_ID=285029 /ORGANISM="Togula jolla, Strain CCCM 725" /LENGTH=340 /DNA_ID=CAMNT_0010928343 /DNA_START=82 /DNA_END=1104 /DNA_ORIENTATION=-
MLDATGSERPVIVLIDPEWTFEARNFSAQQFFEEAQVTELEADVLRSRFDKFAVICPDVEEEPHLTFYAFHQMNSHYGFCKACEEEHFFRAMDRRNRCRLSFDDLLLGAAAASPTTPHVLNSVTGYVRSRYIFEFYNASRSGTLEYEELERLLGDARRHLGEAPEVRQKSIVATAQELGDVSVVTVRVKRLSERLCDVRASTRWTVLRVRRELARLLGDSLEGQSLLLGQRLLPEDECLDQFLPTGATSIEVTLVQSDLAVWPCSWTSSTVREVSDVPGVERLVHVTFESLYNSIVAERLRGTSRLFRLQRSVLHTRKRADSKGSTGGRRGASNAAAGGA